MTDQAFIYDRSYLPRRLKDETKAALDAQDPKVCAAHVQLAMQYLRVLNARK